jgi:receptor-binding and translocation channel-forming TcA subunit of Tc toxin
MRRVKTASLTIPCVVGPYTSVNATLTLLKSEVRVDGSARTAYPKDEDGSDARFVTNFAPLQSVAMSHAQNDSGLFELNFRDERYLPFEGAGAVSTWRLELTRDFRAFDYDTISDVILQLRYTARDGGATLKTAAVAALKDWVAQEAASPLARFFSARHEFPNDWHRFLYPVDGATDQTLTLDMGPDRFPFPFRGMEIGIGRMEVFLKLKDGFVYKDNTNRNLLFDLKREGGASYAGNELKLGGSPIPTLAGAVKDLQESTGSWSVVVKEADLENLDPSNSTLKQTVSISGTDHVRLNPAAVEDLWILCHYSV